MNIRFQSRLTHITLIVIIFMTVVFGATWFAISSGILSYNNPDRKDYPLRGIDVSHHQGNIDWSKVAKDDVAFAYIKATEADDWVDPNFKYNIDQANKNNVPAGAYHFYSLAYPGRIQAENFIRATEGYQMQLPPVVDLEYVGNSKQRPSKEEFQAELKVFMQKLTEHFGGQPIIYTTYEFSDDYLYFDFSHFNYAIWIRDVNSEPDERIGNWRIWQYSSNGRVDGIEGDVDLNVLSTDSLVGL